MSSRHAPARGGGRGRLQLLPGQGQVRTFEFSSHLLGSQHSIDFIAGPAANQVDASDGGAYLFTWAVGAGVTEVMSQGLFWEFAPGQYANMGVYSGGLSDGVPVGGVDEAELSAEVLRGSMVATLADCKPAPVSNGHDAGP